MTQENTIPQKTINNAISSYLMIFISGAFLLNKSDEHINNNFVRSHTKVAFLIHLSFLINYIIFISLSFLKGISIFGYSLNYIIASSIFTILFTALLYGIYNASKTKMFKIGDFISLGHREKVIDINGDNTLDEKDKLTLILSYIPLVGYLINGQYHKNKTVKNIVLLNMIIIVIITVIYIFGYTNVSLLFLLFYIIFSVFSSINIIVSNTIIGININFIPNPEEKISIFKAAYKYIKNYIGKKEFIGIHTLKNSEAEKRKKQEIYNEKILKEKKMPQIPNIFIYIPLINIIFLSQLNSKQRFHIINGLVLSIIFIIVLILNYFNFLPSKLLILFVFPICFGIGYQNSRLAYKMPFIYEIYETAVKVKKLFSRSKKVIQTKQAEEHTETHRVGEKKDDSINALYNKKD